MTTIIGIDPGSRFTGFGIISDHQGVQCAVDFGVIHAQGEQLSERLHSIHQQLKQLRAKHQLDVLAIEGVFFSKNALPCRNALRCTFARPTLCLTWLLAGREREREREREIFPRAH